MIRVETDPHSGFCAGVIRAIGTAEAYLREHGAPLYSLGEIVHNEEELSRLRSLGLVTLDSLNGLGPECGGESVLIRAHGVPPRIYSEAARRGLKLIDCTCPVVLGLQKAIKRAYSAQSSAGGRILLFGKTGHPEVLGLVGQVGGDVRVFQDLEHLKGLSEGGLIDYGHDIELFSQTTMSPSEYALAGEYLSLRMCAPARLAVHRSICAQVASRHRELQHFAAGHDVIVFVAGRMSSNGQVLFDLCRSVNPRCHRINSAPELKSEWFEGAVSAGVCGATSTPKWLLEEVARGIENLQ